MTLNVTAIIINAVLAGVAVFANVWASRHSFPELRPVFAVVALMATLYCVAYAWLACNVEHAAKWSAVIRPVSILAWPVVWISMALLTTRIWRRLQQSARAVIEGSE